ncbi:FeoA domain-containing protein [Caldivirga sp. UBA161]|uniref:FeoA domain-containing protein n=1 Tax=Caldivirga sp. UBA161 TaxID=1915569 RepID=UPI0025BCFFAD|nr:FeoA domain-containing protein [Caldivirga sp. UBA161]
MNNAYTPINKAPSNSMVRVVKLGSERLSDLGIMEGYIIKVIVSIPNGPVLVQREDGAFIVLDTDTASNTLVSVLSIQQGKHRHRWRWRYSHNQDAL